MDQTIISAREGPAISPKSMQVAFDARMVHHSGIGTYIRELTRAMQKLPRENEAPQISLRLHGDVAELQKYEHLKHVGTLVQNDTGVYSWREQLLWPDDKQADAWHFPHYNVPRLLKKPFFVTIHDLIHLLFPEQVKSTLKWIYGRSMLYRAADDALAIFTVSEWSRDDIVRELEVPKEKVVVTPNGIPGWWQKQSSDAVERVRQRHKLPQRFLLTVGIHKPHKNFEWLIKTYGKWHRHSKSRIDLVICGLRPEDVAELARFAAEHDWHEAVHFLPFLDHEELPAVYQAAEALVFPSLYEGFGLPILEAQRVGTPVIASNASCIPWVAGQGVMLFDPRNEDSLVDCLERYFEDHDALRPVMELKGYENCERFSWEASARQTINTYQAMLS